LPSPAVGAVVIEQDKSSDGIGGEGGKRASSSSLWGKRRLREHRGADNCGRERQKTEEEEEEEEEEEVQCILLPVVRSLNVLMRRRRRRDAPGE
jgi:hypothetical protein